MIEVIAGLKATAADLACRSITDQEVAAIEAKHHAMVAAWKRNDNPTYFTLNRQIHEMIMQASGNARFQGLYENLSGRIQRARYAAHRPPNNGKAVDEHEQILDLLKKRDGNRSPCCSASTSAVRSPASWLRRATGFRFQHSVVSNSNAWSAGRTRTGFGVRRRRGLIIEPR